MIIVNFKAYSEAIGSKAAELADQCRRASEDTGKKVVVCPQTVDLLRVNGVRIESFCQHIDPVKPGSHTGSTSPDAVVDAGISGVLINHSEKRLETDTIEKTVKKARKLGLTSIVCAQDPEECETYSEFGPDYIAYEPPELIGGDVSVSSAKPELIHEAVKKSGEVATLTGAGIKTKEDVEKSIEHGCEGVLVASGVIKAENPYAEVKELCEGLEAE